jgi:hypothetical protein
MQQTTVPPSATIPPKPTRPQVNTNRGETAMASEKQEDVAIDPVLVLCASLGGLGLLLIGSSWLNKRMKSSK